MPTYPTIPISIVPAREQSVRPPSVPPPRGFERLEFERRTARAQALLHNERLDALLVTTEPEFRYFSGFQSQFWESPTRPWFKSQSLKSSNLLSDRGKRLP